MKIKEGVFDQLADVPYETMYLEINIYITKPILWPYFIFLSLKNAQIKGNFL